MRLEKVRNGHKLVPKIMMTVMGKLFRMGGTPDVVRALLYRPELFGAPHSRWLQATLRGPSSWSIGERELFAAFTSRLNHCSF